jgi:hypothetical protein
MGTRARIAVLLVGVAASLGPLAAPASAETIAAILPGNTLALFDSASPAQVTTRSITGIGFARTVRGIDVRPVSGEVYIVSATTGAAANSGLELYTLDVNTGRATLIGATAAALAGAADIPTGFDFNPALVSGVPIDRVRYVNTNDENARLVPDTGGLAGNDTDLTPAATTDVIAEAYDRNVRTTAQTTLYAIDRNASYLAIQGGINSTPSPNGGVITDLAPLGFGVNLANDGGFDVSPSGVAFAALTNAGDNLTRLYTVSLPTAVTATPAATAVGLIGNGATQVYSLTVLDDDRDADGRLTTADNCPSVSNADQANLDGDGLGDVCDDDDDADGIPDAVEAAFGTNPRSGDSDGDGKADSVDRCPVVPAPTASGCLDPIPTALSFRLTGVATRVTLRTIRTSGLSLTVEPNQPASFLVELLGRARTFRLADVGYVALAERRLAAASGRRTTRLTVPRSQRARLRRKVRLRLRVTATDAVGRKAVITRVVTIR